MSTGPKTRDQAHMRAALALAARGLGLVAPNPAVGCVIVRDGQVVGRGWTQPGGRPHAETEALARAGAAAAGATAYVSLEPCAHRGRTPPCADALIAAGIARCVVATGDPDPRVDGRGVRRLKAAGITVEGGVLGEKAQDLNAGFLLAKRHGRPLITLKLATSLDGRIACANGESRWVTGGLARRHAHRVRAAHDAIMVGSGTALADDPRLDVRLAGLEKESPIRVVIDSRLRLPASHDLATRSARQATLVFTTRPESDPAAKALSDAGVTVVTVPKGAADRAELGEVMARLAARGVTRLLVEGGGDLAAALVRRKLVDRILWYRADCLIGGDGRAALGALGLTTMTQAPRYQLAGGGSLGRDRYDILERADRPWRLGVRG